MEKRDAAHAHFDCDELVVKPLACVDAELLYARVDLVPGLDGELLVMELELVEPYLYPEQGPRLGERVQPGITRPMWRSTSVSVRMPTRRP